jgi:hypothetical protein
MPRINRHQKLFLSAEYLFDINPLNKYQILFDHLDASAINIQPQGPGRHPVPKSALLRALIYKNLKPLPTLSDLVLELADNPSITLKCGLDPSRVPPVERFSSFLRDTNNLILQTVRNSLVKELISIGEISGKILSIDSYPIPANVKENNLKTNLEKNRFDKHRIPKGDHDCRLGVMVQFLPPQKKVSFFWGYRNHTITDMPSELPVIEVTKPANVADLNLLIPLFRQTKNTFDITPKIVLADSIYDSEKILSFVIDELKAMPRIARNYRWKKHRPVRLSPVGNPICLAGFEMIYWGKFTDRGKLRKKFCCPITHSKKFAKTHPVCPWNHPTFLKGKGCVCYLRGDRDIRKSIDYGSQLFKEQYNMRSGSERLASRLLTLTMQDPSVRGLSATANYCTIAHIAVLLVALTAAKSGHKDKIRFIKNFLPNL